MLASAMVALGAGTDGAIWAGTYGKGLWRVKGDEVRQFTTAHGLSSDQIRSLYQGRDGTLWIGTFGGGLMRCRDGKFSSFTEKDGLLSDNVADISDDGESLWLSTTRGICRIAKQQLDDFAARPPQASGAGQLRPGGRTAQRAVLAELSRSAAAAIAPPTAGSGSPPAAASRCSIRARTSSRCSRPRCNWSTSRRTASRSICTQPARLEPERRARADPLHRRST